MSAFVGRVEPLGRLDAAYRAIGGTPANLPRARLVLVNGEAGIGKTALLAKFSAEAAAQGATVVWGTCWDGDQAPAWWPWTQALDALLHHHGELREGVAAELATILPGLATGAPLPVQADTAARIRVLDGANSLLSQGAAKSPLVVILDDLQWADRSTVDLSAH